MAASHRRYNAVELARRSLEEGRRPSYDSEGNIRGLRSRPGATMSPRDAAQAPYRLPAADPNTGFTDDDAWKSFFHPPKPPRAAQPDTNAFQTAGGLLPELAPQGTGSADDMASFISRPYASPQANPSALYSAAANNHATYLRKGATLPALGSISSISTPYGKGSVRPAALVEAERRRRMPAHERKWQELSDAGYPGIYGT
jgi:hypothetical protein